ncbi:MAG TPA: FtsX-like permease family protein, partial [Acidobacteriota bacterium]|nr:FtsX-like permease family protein [Acidobacteriota bacterium]
ARVSLPPDRYQGGQSRMQFYHQLLDDLQARPAVLSAGVVNLVPMSGNTSDWSIAAEGYTPPDPDVPDFIQYRITSSDYFKALGIPLISGRYFERRDALEDRPVTILSQSLVRKYWGEEEAVGRRIKPGGLNSSSDWLTVVGVVGDVYHAGARRGPIPIWYRPLNRSWGSMTLVLRGSGEPNQAVKTLSDALHRLDPEVPLHQPRLMTEMVAGTLSQERFNTSLLAAFSVLALILAAVGIYGVISYSVGRRTHEIGIRMAVGAPRQRILLQVLREGGLLVGAGLLLGLIAAVPLTRFMESLLFGVGNKDPFTFLVIAAVLLAVGLAACLGPARRATRVNPIVALRNE